jgi:hypothetical protein
MINIDTDKAYILGLIIGGGILKNKVLQVSLPYKKWGDLKINPQRGGGIAEDILVRAKPLWKLVYGIDISYKIETDWKIICDTLSEKLIKDFEDLELLHDGEFRENSSLEKIIPHLKNNEIIKSFIAGIVDTVGSLAKSHRRFTDQFQIVSLEFKGQNFQLVKDIVGLLIKFVHYRKVVPLRRNKKKSIHHITRHIWLRLLYKSLHPYLPPLRYGKHQICQNVVH